MSFTRYLWLMLVSMVTLSFQVVNADIITGVDFERWGGEVMAQLQSSFARSDGLYSKTPTDGWPEFAWGQGIMLGANVAAAETDPAYLSRATKQAQEMRSRYRCYYNGYYGFDASYNGCGDRYYDDNAWIALAYLELYELTGTQSYLDWAREILIFCMSGENGPTGTPNGGIRWHESNTTGASVCATAPTILANLLAYQFTDVQKYLTDAQRLYNWLKSSDLKSANWVYHETDQGPLGYQTAVMTQAATQLYIITGEENYLKEAQMMASSMEAQFINNDGVLTQHGKWGGHDMTNAYVELYEVDGNSHWLDVAATYLEYIYVNCLDGASGLYPEVWSNISGTYSNGLIDTASVARSYWKMAGTVGGSTRYSYYARERRSYWKFDETAGATAVDASGFGNNGTLTGMTFASNATTGKISGGLNFDGVDDYVDLPDGFADFRSGMTVTLWAYPTAVQNWARFIDFGNGEYNSNIVFARRGTTTNLVFEGYDRTNSGGQVIAEGVISLNQWQMFTATMDAEGNVVIYKNGEPKAMGKTAVPTKISRVNNYIGKSNWLDAYYKGKMDDVQIYNYALSAEQVQQLYLAGGQAVNPSPADGALDTVENKTLSWVPGTLAVGHDVYFGTDAAAVANATIGSSEYKGRQSAASYVPELLPATTYYWRIDEYVSGIVTAKGTVWSFSTTTLSEDGLLAYYNMDNGYFSGSTLIDSSKSPILSGTMYGPTKGAVGKVGQALSFDGTNDYVKLPDGFDDLSGGLSVSVWAYPTSTGNWSRFIDLGNGAANNSIVLARNGTSNALSFEVFNGSSSGGQISISNAITLNQWQMFTVTLNAAGYAQLYKNGVRIGKGTTIVPPVINRTSNYIGRSNWSDAYYKGRMDEFSIWSRQLTGSEVAAMYGRGSASRSLAASRDPSQPVLHWQCNEAGGMVVNDVSGNGYNGTLVNADASIWTSGKLCGGLNYDGVDDYVEAYGFKGITGNSSRTSMAWIRTDSPGFQIMHWGTPVTSSLWLMMLNDNGTVRIGAYGGNINGVTNLADGRWHHVAVTLENDGSPDISEAVIYVDGQRESVSTYIACAVNTSMANNLRSGLNIHAAAWYAGQVDEVRIYGRSLSAAEIGQIYEQQVLVSDFNDDGVVNLSDLSRLAGDWLTSNSVSDLTCDCYTDIEDLKVMAEEWLAEK